MKTKLIFTFLLVLSITNCSSLGKKQEPVESPVKVEKTEGFNPDSKKIATMSVYNLDKKQLGDKSDIILVSFGASVDARIGEIYGNSVVGGDEITKLAAKLKLKDFDKTVENFAESAVSGGVLSEASIKTLSTITSKGKIDSLALPIVSGGFDTLKTGNEISIVIAIFEAKTAKIGLIGKHSAIKAKQEDITLAESKPDQAKANMMLGLLEKNEILMKEIQNQKLNKNISNEIATGKEDPSTKDQTAEVKSEENVEEAVAKTQDTNQNNTEEEALQGLDNWLVSKIKIGLGPLVLGFTGLLFLFL